MASDKLVKIKIYNDSLKQWDEAEFAMTAYDTWLNEGNNGSIQDFLDSLNGLSAYELAVKNGFSGTEAEWLLSLKGEHGNSGGITSPINGFFTMYVDNSGNLFVVTADDGVNPIRYDESGGELYYKVS